MKKWILIFCLFLFISSVSAYSGVSPAYYERDFKPNFKESFIFRFNVPSDVRVDLVVEGDLEKYAKLDKKSMKGSGAVIALVELPEKLETPGDRYIRVRAMQYVEGVDGVVIALNVGGVIKIKVPYPGEYAELDFKVNDANQGEPVNLDLTVFSKGERDIFVKAFVDIYEGNNNLVERVFLGEEKIESAKGKKFLSQLDTSEYVAGNYRAVAVAEYGLDGSTSTSKNFKLGRLFVDVSNHTKEFEKDKINRFVIEVESLWNDPISSLYADVDIIGHDESFRTPTVSLAPWRKNSLTGFFDTSEIEDDKFYANITLYYDGSSNSRVVELKFVRDANYQFYILLGISVLVGIVLLVLLVVYIKKNFKVVKNEKRK
jgi:hypothetical protein